jgi:hypothetical protein
VLRMADEVIAEGGARSEDCKQAPPLPRAGADVVTQLTATRLENSSQRAQGEIGVGHIGERVEKVRQASGVEGGILEERQRSLRVVEAQPR